MLVSRRIPILAYLFLASLIALLAFKFHLSTLSDGGVFEDGIEMRWRCLKTKMISEDDPTPFDFALNFILKPTFPDNLNAGNTPNVLVLVTTTASEGKMREQVRQSWANYTSRAVRVEFLIGIPVSGGFRILRIHRVLQGKVMESVTHIIEKLRNPSRLTDSTKSKWKIEKNYSF